MWLLYFDVFDVSCDAEVCGTPGYLAPEIIQCSMDGGYKGYGTAVDMWVSSDEQVVTNLSKWL